MWSLWTSEADPVELKDFETKSLEHRIKVSTTCGSHSVSCFDYVISKRSTTIASRRSRRRPRTSRPASCRATRRRTSSPRRRTVRPRGVVISSEVALKVNRIKVTFVSINRRQPTFHPSRDLIAKSYFIQWHSGSLYDITHHALTSSLLSLRRAKIPHCLCSRHNVFRFGPVTLFCLPTFSVCSTPTQAVLRCFITTPCRAWNAPGFIPTLLTRNVFFIVSLQRIRSRCAAPRSTRRRSSVATTRRRRPRSPSGRRPSRGRRRPRCVLYISKL